MWYYLQCMKPSRTQWADAAFLCVCVCVSSVCQSVTRAPAVLSLTSRSTSTNIEELQLWRLRLDDTTWLVCPLTRLALANCSWGNHLAIWFLRMWCRKPWLISKRPVGLHFRSCNSSSPKISIFSNSSMRWQHVWAYDCNKQSHRHH